MAEDAAEQVVVGEGVLESLRPLADAGLSDQGVWTLLDAAPDGIVLADEDGKILFVNRQMELLFGYDRAELLSRSVDQLLPERDWQLHRAHRTRYRVAPKTRSMGAGLALLGRRADGSEFPVEISLSPLQSDEGLRVVATVRDVTERTNADAELRRVLKILDLTSDAVLIFDARTWRFTFVNAGAQTQVHYSRDELLTMNMLHLAPEFTEATLRDLLDSVKSAGSASTVFTTIHRRRDGVDVPVEVALQAIIGDDGEPEAYVKIVRDITTRLAQQRQLLQAEQHLRVFEDRERIARDLHDVVIQELFAAGMTLHATAGRCADPDLTGKLIDVVDSLDRAIEDLRSAIFDLHKPVAVGLDADIMRVVGQAQPALGFTPNVKFEGPIATVPATVITQLLPTVREALANVARHARATAVQMTITATAEQLRLVVTDNGIGIHTENTAGNGLRNMHQRAETLHGTCTLTNEPTGGTTLQWTVPIDSPTTR